MRRINRTISIVTMLAGFFVAAWGPTVFQAVTGTSLPTPQGSAAMIIWAGVAFARAFGAVLVVLGAFLWAANRSPNTTEKGSVLPVLAAVFAALVVWAQEQAIWTTGVGFVFVALVSTIAISAAATFLKSVDTGRG